MQKSPVELLLCHSYNALIMSWITTAACITAWALTLVFFCFLFVSVVERETRAAWVSFFLSLPVLGTFHALWLADLPHREHAALLAVAVLAAAIVLLVIPIGRVTRLKVIGRCERVDERDAVFHRFYRIEPGTPEFNEYYEKHPEKRAFDDKVRELPRLADPGSKTYNPLSSPFQAAAFSAIEEISRDLDPGMPTPLDTKAVDASPREFTRSIKGFAGYLGADLAGCTKLNPSFVYSRIGRSPGRWGEAIELDHGYALAIAIEMSHDMVRHAPASPTTTETAFKYYEAGKVAMIVARYIRLLGYNARAHVDGNYRVLCVPIAADAGLGELGRLGLLVTPEFGPRIRLSIVTTDLPLVQDEPVAFGVQEFCSLCKKCADVCPSGSIDKGLKKEHNGVVKWRSEQDSCYRYWRIAGSDCGLCMKVCPFSHPDNLAHNAVRRLIRQNSLARKIAIYGDDLLYGRRPDSKHPLPPWHP